jgi:hypothetical protein
MSSHAPRPRVAVAGAVLVGLVLLVGACAAPEATPTTVPSDGLDDQSRRVLSRLPECADPPDEQDVGEVEGLVIPEGVRLTGIEHDGPLTTVTGWVGMNPIGVRTFYERRTLGVLKTLMIEDEILESEALMESRTHRLYIKAQAACRDASDLWIVVAENVAKGQLPEPGSTQAPGPPPPAPPTSES